jgi:hypothetical protein
VSLFPWSSLFLSWSGSHDSYDLILVVAAASRAISLIISNNYDGDDGSSDGTCHYHPFTKFPGMFFSFLSFSSGMNKAREGGQNW